MSQPDAESASLPDYDAQRRRRTIVIVMAVGVLLVIVGALHVVGVLPAGD
jgi:predicted nucleic acid-binding Zn ribbon protein